MCSVLLSFLILHGVNMFSVEDMIHSHTICAFFCGFIEELKCGK